MSTIGSIAFSDTQALSKVDALLAREGIKRDANLDYICAMYDEEYKIIATGSTFGNTLRCFAVDSSHRGEGLLNEIITHLIEIQYQKGNTHLFVYTKASTAKFFKDLGFYEVAMVKDKLVFLENRRTAFSEYIDSLHIFSKIVIDTRRNCSGAIIMNANPFTLGHQYLVEQASRECQLVHLFIVSEDSSLIPYSVRRQLVKEGVKHLGNVVCHDSGPYIISNATFPSYFLKDEEDVIYSHAMLDINIFIKIAKALNIKVRYVGEEPFSLVTSLYNKVMLQELPMAGIECKVIKRKCVNDAAISASTVRECLKAGNLVTLKTLVPKSTYEYFTSTKAAPILAKLRATQELRHY